MELEFTPLEFETTQLKCNYSLKALLEFTPLEFETIHLKNRLRELSIRIYSVGV